jgi:ribose-phosphate pyrophosphokinase
MKRADALRDSLARALGRPVGAAFMEKRRSEGVVSGEAVVGEVAGMTAIIVDDLISGGTTLARAAAACTAMGAKRVIAAASHGLFIGAAADMLAGPALEKLLVTDSVPPFRLPPALLGTRVEMLDTAPLFAEAIRRLHEGGSLVELLQA